MSIKHARKAVVTALAVAALTLAGAGTASADGVVTWHHRPSDNCLAIVINGAGQPYEVGMNGCDVGHGWYEQYNSNDGTWLMKPQAQAWRGYCLTAYSDDDVYMEPCQPNNDWQRWYERWTGSSWKLQHKQTGRWLDSNGRSVYLGPGGWNNDNKYQLWY
ncbi:hypothetical protein [Streptomyces sp. NPDC048710]|uniref:hypothetical protein n=1 Tax=unclassified Streptomyces TaxID=2593676 RepID=UPI003711D901